MGGRCVPLLRGQQTIERQWAMQLRLYEESNKEVLQSWEVEAKRLKQQSWGPSGRDVRIDAQGRR